jgi:hypothetical protein
MRGEKMRISWILISKYIDMYLDQNESTRGGHHDAWTQLRSLARRGRRTHLNDVSLNS